MLLRLVHHLSDMQGVLLQGCKIKGGHIAEGLVRISPLLSDKWTCALRCSACLTAVKNEDNLTGCQRYLAMGHCFSACVNQSSTVHVNHLLGDFPSVCVGLLSVLYAFTDTHCFISLDP